MRRDPVSTVLWVMMAVAALLALALLVLWCDQPPPALNEGQPTADGSDRPACTPADPCLALVIDDIGRDLPALRELLALRLDLTYGVLPHARHTAEALAAVTGADREYLLHLPMAPRDRSQVTDETVILSPGVAPEPALMRCLARVPGARIVSNHMGSAMSESTTDLAGIMRFLRKRGLAFFDSKTTPQSQICASAAKHGVPCVQRDVFLDDPNDVAEVADRLQAALKLARQQGWAIAIGHPQTRTIDALQRFARGRSAVTVVRLSWVMASTQDAP